MNRLKVNNNHNDLNHYWRSDGMDWIADLNQMKKAIVVAYYTPILKRSFYAISPRSFFPFTGEQFNKHFDNYYDCCIYAEQIIRDWVQSLFIVNDNIKSITSDQKPMIEFINFKM